MFLAYSSIFTTLDILKHICSHLGIFWQIQAYSHSWHSQTYSCILKHIQNQWLIQGYSEPFWQFQTLTQARNVSRIFRHIHKFTHTEAYQPTLRLRHIQDPGIIHNSTLSSNQVLLINHFSDLFGTFFIASKVNHSTIFSSRQYFNSSSSNKNNMPPTLARHPCHLCSVLRQTRHPHHPL